MDSSGSDSISIIPGGTLQFVDILFNSDKISKLRRSFYEYEGISNDTGGEKKVFLMSVEFDEELNCYLNRANNEKAVDSNTGRAVQPSYDVVGQKALEMYQGEWVPLPVFRVNSEYQNLQGGFDKGPSNWVRGCLKKLDKRDDDGNTHSFTLVFDSRTESCGGEHDYHALEFSDESNGAEFALAVHENDCGWFLNLPWVDGWLEQLYMAHVEKYAASKGRKVRPEDIPYACEYLARYLTFLEVLKTAEVMPRVRLVNARRNAPIEVDLILDIGNSRTCGMLVETRPDESTSLNDSYVLELRNLTRPWVRYREPFDSRLEFALAKFGDPKGFSKDSGRRSEAFAWPSVIRVGPEAAELGVFSRSAEGRTGMSSPKRYLWDEYGRTERWRFNSGSSDPSVREEPVVKGAYVQYVNNEGTPLDRVDDRSLRGSPAFRDQTFDPVTLPRFSRSSLMMFMLSEIIAHTLVTINSPENRSNLARPDVPRRLRRIVLTMPPAMPIAERKIFLRWAKWAVDTTWQTLEWDQLDATDARDGFDYRLKPLIQSDVDEASATQVVYLYNEIVDRFRGDVRSLMRLVGQQRQGYDQETLRVASIDIGGGTTDLIVTTYETVGSGAAAVIKPIQEFREGLNIAGDDILKAVIESHFLRTLQTAFREAGVVDAEGLVNELMGGDFGGQSEKARTLRMQFANQVAVPIGLKILRRYEEYDPQSPGGMESQPFGAFFTPETYPRPEVIEYVDQTVRRNGGADFSIQSFELQFDLNKVDHTVKSTIGPVINDLCEVVFLYDCDLLLLSGRPARQPAIRAAVLAKSPLPPHKVIAMHKYRVGNWYPFRSLHSQISDPKTTASVGALLCTLAEGQLDWFRFQSHLLSPKSTARFIGEMELSGQIQNDKVFFPALDLDNRDEIEIEHTFDFYAPIPIGFRQLEADRWTATPFYWVSFASAQAAQNSRGRTPYRVTLSFQRGADEGDAIGSHGGVGDIRDEGVFRIVEPVEAMDGTPVRHGDLQLRLQTLKDEKGYWLDTGSFFDY